MIQNYIYGSGYKLSFVVFLVSGLAEVINYPQEKKGLPPLEKVEKFPVDVDYTSTVSRRHVIIARKNRKTACCEALRNTTQVR